EPVELVAERVPLFEHAIRSLAEDLRVALVFHREAANGDAVHLLDTGLELVTPRDVIGRARREHVDLRVARQVLRDVARVQLGATADRLPVPLYDDGELHCAEESGPCPGEPSPGPSSGPSSPSSCESVCSRSCDGAVAC